MLLVLKPQLPPLLLLVSPPAVKVLLEERMAVQQLV
jgi:hypothetical protein